MIRVATCQYAIEKISTWQNYVKKIESIVTRAKEKGAQLLLLPEYAGLEVGGRHQSDEELYAAIQPLISKYCDLFKKLSCYHQIYIQPGTIIEEILPGKYVNRAYFFNPEGKIAYQDKLQLIEFEKHTQLIQPGNSQSLFASALGNIGIAICYDSEFPEIVRRLVFAGASLILVPSYTTSLAGYHRVFLSCRARALENQCYVVAAFVVGRVALTDPMEDTVGQSAILGPIDEGFANDGIIAQGTMNAVAITTADLSLEKLLRVREQGQVHNFEDAKRCSSLTENEVEVINFT